MLRIWAILLFLGALGTSAFTQSALDPDRAAGIRVMRAINTAENMVRGQSGKYVELAELINHKTMGGVRQDIVTNGSLIFYQGRQLRLALAPDASQYQAMVVR
jgi:hypothetical protein